MVMAENVGTLTVRTRFTWVTVRCKVTCEVKIVMRVSDNNLPADKQFISAFQLIRTSDQNISRFLQHIYIPCALLSNAVTSLGKMASNSMLWCLVNCES
jgi:hypothetical protein